jgi:hypothetical protein
MVTRQGEPAEQAIGEPEAELDESEPDESASVTRNDEAADGIDWLTPEESRAFFDEMARELLGISGDEFLRRWDAGEYYFDIDHPDVVKIDHLGALVPFGR